MQEKDYLFVKKSQIPASGNGLYTLITIPANYIVAEFYGKIISKTQWANQVFSKSAEHCINIDDDHVFDYSQHDGFAKIANDAGFGQSKFQNNSVISRVDNKFVICSTKTIYAGQEIFVAYGNAFWNAHTNLKEYNIQKIFNIK